MKARYYLWTSPRWFAAPFFGSAVLMGVVLAGGSIFSWTTVLVLAMALSLMASGHTLNSYLDYAVTKLDQGDESERSAEKSYTGGQNLLAEGAVTPNGVHWAAIGWLVLSSTFLFLGWRATSSFGYLWMFLGLGIALSVWYSFSKFNYTHELTLGILAGPLPVLMGMFASNPNPDWVRGIVVSVPFAIILAFAGLALDEYPDAEANLKKGVKSVAYKVWQYQPTLYLDFVDNELGRKVENEHVEGMGIYTYVGLWLVLLYVFQVFLITIGHLKPLTFLTFALAPVFMASLVFLKANFGTAMLVFVGAGSLYGLLLVLGQVV